MSNNEPKIHVESLEARIARLEERTESIEEIRENVNSILLELSRYKGFFGGLLLILSSLGAAIKLIPFVGSLFTKQ